MKAICCTIYCSFCNGKILLSFQIFGQGKVKSGNLTGLGCCEAGLTVGRMESINGNVHTVSISM